MTDLNIQKQLAQYINFHSHPHASFYNTIEGIVSKGDSKEDIEAVMKLLQKDYIFINYEQNKDVNTFLKELSNALSQNKTIFISTNTLKFDPVIFDQLIHFREYNGFNVKLIDGSNEDLSAKPISEDANLFLIYRQENDEKAPDELYALTDHLLDLRKENGYAAGN